MDRRERNKARLLEWVKYKKVIYNHRELIRKTHRQYKEVVNGIIGQLVYQEGLDIALNLTPHFMEANQTGMICVPMSSTEVSISAEDKAERKRVLVYGSNSMIESYLDKMGDTWRTTRVPPKDLRRLLPTELIEQETVSPELKERMFEFLRLSG